MKILLVVTKADLSGAPIHVRDIAIELDRTGYEVLVVAGSDGTILSQLRDNGVSVSIVPSMKSDLNLFSDIKSICEIRELFRTFEPDLVHAHSSKAGMISRISTFLFSRKTPVVFTVHGWGFGKNRPLLSSCFVYATEFICRFITDFYIFVSEYDKTSGMKHLGISNDRSTVIWNGVNAPIERKVIDSRQSADIVMVARNQYPKDYRTLILALQFINFDRVVFVGEDTDEKAIIEFARKNLGDRANQIDFIGASNDVASFLSNAKIFVLSSYFEGFPLSIVEAMSHGVPVVASNVGGISEMIKDGHTGLLFEPGNFRNLAILLESLIGDRTMRIALGKNGEDFYRQNLDFHISFSKLEYVYDKLCRNRL